MYFFLRVNETWFRQLLLPVRGGGERWDWLKPIMFTGGIGQIDDRHIKKE
jgi:hypothetical protein